jgi:hypothetical protein
MGGSGAGGPELKDDYYHETSKEGNEHNIKHSAHSIGTAVSTPLHTQYHGEEALPSAL